MLRFEFEKIVDDYCDDDDFERLMVCMNDECDDVG